MFQSRALGAYHLNRHFNLREDFPVRPQSIQPRRIFNAKLARRSRTLARRDRSEHQEQGGARALPPLFLLEPVAAIGTSRIPAAHAPGTRGGSRHRSWGAQPSAKRPARPNADWPICRAAHRCRDDAIVDMISSWNGFRQPSASTMLSVWLGCYTLPAKSDQRVNSKLVRTGSLSTPQ